MRIFIFKSEKSERFVGLQATSPGIDFHHSIGPGPPPPRSDRTTPRRALESYNVRPWEKR
jgi:hypothetical protein